MEYFLKIDRGSRRLESNLPFAAAAGASYAVEGHLFDAAKIAITDPRCPYASLAGAFNLFIHRPGSQLQIVNDKFGLLSLFCFISDRELLFSNNFWRLAQQVGTSPDQIDYTELRRFIFFIGCSPNHTTFIKGINLLPPATALVYDFSHDTISFDCYWSYSRNGSVTDLQVAVDQAYHAIDHNFLAISECFQGRRFLFGNSGGLDSRLIPYFARKHGLDLTGFTILRKRDRLGMRTATYRASARVCREYRFPQHYISRVPANYNDRLLLDIRNAPVTSCNMLDNPFEHLSEFKEHILIYGNPAYLIGHSAWSIAKGYGDSVSWNYFLYYLLRSWDLNPSKLRDLSECINVDDFLGAAEAYRPFFERHKSLGYIQLFQLLHYHCMDLTAHAGGFESISRTLRSLTLYHPYLEACSANWSDELFRNRAILKELNRRVNPGLNDVHDQEFAYLDGAPWLQAQVLRLRRRLSMSSSGMDLTRVTQSKDFLRFARDILHRENPYFEPLGDAAKLFALAFESTAFLPSFTLNFLKVKKMLDLLYYGECASLDREAFRIA